jgi:Ca2+-binding EF-hand superfamily protein
MKSINSILTVLALSVAFATAADEAKPKRDPAETIKKLDKNGDGKVSAEEWKAIPSAKTDPAKNAESFKKLDKNADGFITLEEMAVVGGSKGKK